MLVARPHCLIFYFDTHCQHSCNLGSLFELPPVNWTLFGPRVMRIL